MKMNDGLWRQLAHPEDRNVTKLERMANVHYVTLPKIAEVMTPDLKLNDPIVRAYTGRRGTHRPSPLLTHVLLLDLRGPHLRQMRAFYWVRDERLEN